MKNFVAKHPVTLRVYHVPIKAVRADYIQFLVDNDGISRKQAAAQIDAEPRFLETWFVEQWSWSLVRKQGTLAKDMSKRHRLKLLAEIEDDHPHVPIDKII